MANEIDHSGRREESETSGEKYDAGENRYRLGPEGTLVFHRAFMRTAVEPIIEKLRRNLTLIEGEAEAEDWEQAERYLLQIEPWLYQLKQKITDAKEG